MAVKPIVVCTAAILSVALPSHASQQHLSMCSALAVSYLSAHASSPEVDAFAKAIVCSTPQPKPEDVLSTGLRLTYVVAGTPLALLWSKDLSQAAAALTKLCPVGQPVPPIPDLVAVVRASGDNSALDDLNECLVKSYETNPVTCIPTSDAGGTSIVVHHRDSTQRIIAVSPSPAPVAGIVPPYPLSNTGTGLVSLGRKLHPGETAEVYFSDGQTCSVGRLRAPDFATVTISAFGKGIKCPPAHVFQMEEPGNPDEVDKCDINVDRSRVFRLAPNLRLRPHTSPSASKYTANCPGGDFSRINSVASDPANGTVKVSYHLQGCGFTKIPLPFFFIEYCNGRAWLGANIVTPILELTGNRVLEPQEEDFHPEHSRWARLAYFSTLMADDFALQGFDWEVRIEYTTTKSPGPTRLATLNPGSTRYQDSEEGRCFVTFFDQTRGGLFLFGSDRLAECDVPLTASEYKEVLSVGDPCFATRRDGAIPFAPDIANCHAHCSVVKKP